MTRPRKGAPHETRRFHPVPNGRGLRQRLVGRHTAVTGANGGQIESTGPPFKVRATCSCLGKTPTWPVLTQQPNAYAPRSVPVYAAWFQLPCLQPARGPL